MDIGNKGKVLVSDKGRAIVQIGGKKVSVGVRDDIKIKKGDMVIIVLGNVIGKV